MNPAASSAITAPAPRPQAKAATAAQAQPFRVAVAPDGGIAGGDAGTAAAPPPAQGTAPDRKAVQAPVAGDGSGMLALIASALAASAAAAGGPRAAAPAREHLAAEGWTQQRAQASAAAMAPAAAGCTHGGTTCGRGVSGAGNGAVEADARAGAAGDGMADPAGDEAGAGRTRAAGPPRLSAVDDGINGPAPAHAQPAAGAALLQGFAAFAAAAMKAPDVAGASSAAAVAAPRPAANLSLESPQWPQALADQVQWQLDGAVHEVRLDLHPQDLGCIQVQISVDAGAATVQFRAAQPQARAALAAGLPQLRALLGADGVSLLQAQVGRLPRDARLSGSAGDSAAAEGEAAAGAAAPRSRLLRLRLLDDFA